MGGTYFKYLNYSLGDEDSWVEYHLLPEGAKHVLAIAGSGGRVVPLLARSPKQLTCVDISPMQLFLTEMRLAALCMLDHEGYVSFLGYPPEPMTPSQRREAFEALPLREEAAQALGAFFEKQGWKPIIYTGKFEQTLITLSHIVKLFCGKRGRAIFDHTDFQAQKTYYHQQFPHKAWKLVLFLLGNSTVLNSLLYKGDFPKKNIPQSAFSIYRDIFARLLGDMPARESFFLQLVFFGHMPFAEGNPAECDPQVFAEAKKALEDTEVTYILGDVLQVCDPTVDFLSLSDVPSFFKGEVEESYMRQLHPRLAPEARVVYRGHLRLPNPDTQGFTSMAAAHTDLFRAEKTQLWHIYLFLKQEANA